VMRSTLWYIKIIGSHFLTRPAADRLGLSIGLTIFRAVVGRLMLFVKQATAMGYRHQVDFLRRAD
jgi:hypothetical protein